MSVTIVQYTSNGTFTVPANCSEVTFLGIGGGGGAANGHDVGGGGGGGSSQTTISSPSAGDIYSITVGTGGAANSNGSDSFVNNPSGTTILLAKAGQTGTALIGGAGGSLSSGVGDTKVSGGAGSCDNTAGGAGGSAGEASIPANGNIGVHQTGGASPGGLAGAGANGRVGNGTGLNGNSYGGGGGGADNSSGGGSGAGGIVQVTYIITTTVPGHRTKGTGKDCCCGGCYVTPHLVQQGSLPLGSGQYLDPFNLQCCACIPKQVCVTYVCSGSSKNTFLLNYVCNKPGYALQTGDVWFYNQYQGQGVVDGQIVNIVIWFDNGNAIVGGVPDATRPCHLVFSCAELGITGNEAAASITVDDNFRAVMCPGCQSCPEATAYPPTVQWNFSGIAGCSGTTSFTIAPAENTSLIQIVRCCGCADPCYGNTTDLDTRLWHGCAPICGGCTCICTCACITVLHGDSFFSDIACIDCNGVYQTSIFGISIALIGTSHDFNQQITSAANDGWFGVVSGTNSFDDSTTTIQVANTASVQTTGFLRFTNVTIPAGAQILTAFLTLYPKGSPAGTPQTVDISFELSPNPAQIASYSDGISRTQSVTYVSWTAVFQSGLPAVSSDLSALIADIILQNGWSSGNALQLFLAGTSGFNVNFVGEDGTHPAVTAFLDVKYSLNDNCCKLRLNAGTINTGGGSIPDVGISDVSLTNPCPNPIASWSFFDAYAAAPLNQVRVWFNCRSCPSGCDTRVSHCCPDNVVPNLLYATVQNAPSGGCPCSITVPIFYDPTISSWIGEVDGEFCQQNVKITLTCTSNGVTFQWKVVIDAPPCLEASAFMNGTCNPMDLTANLTLSGIGCCGIGNNGGTVTISITQ